MKLKPGELKCEKCNGIGWYLIPSTISGYIECSRCLGSGKLNWIENIVGKTRESRINEYLEEMRDSISDQMIEEFLKIKGKYNEPKASQKPKTWICNMQRM